MITELAVLRWLHIIAMVYWLGGEWGVFQTSTHVINRKLPMEERRRHMETAYRIDILARTGIILLLPLGLHMGTIWGVQPYGGGWLWLIWLLSAGWLGLCWAAFRLSRNGPRARLTVWDERIRYFVIPALLISAGLSLLGYGPFEAGTGQKWFSLESADLRIVADYRPAVALHHAGMDGTVQGARRGARSRGGKHAGKITALRQASGLRVLGSASPPWRFWVRPSLCESVASIRRR